MTYKEIVDKIALICNQHYMIQDFGYGALTDIKTVGDDGAARVNYPYVFLNPTQSARTGQSIIYRFNLIAMDVYRDSDGYSKWLEVQSSCQQYIDDILAQLRFGQPLEKFDLTLNVNLTPFKERFQDTLAGMTATLEIEVPNALNDCLTPLLQLTPFRGGTGVPYLNQFYNFVDETASQSQMYCMLYEGIWPADPTPKTLDQSGWQYLDLLFPTASFNTGDNQLGNGAFPTGEQVYNSDGTPFTLANPNDQIFLSVYRLNHNIVPTQTLEQSTYGQIGPPDGTSDGTTGCLIIGGDGKVISWSPNLDRDAC